MFQQFYFTTTWFRREQEKTSFLPLYVTLLFFIFQIRLDQFTNLFLHKRGKSKVRERDEKQKGKVKFPFLILRILREISRLANKRKKKR